MFVVLLHYLKPLSEIDLHLGAHRAWLDRHYAAGHFVASGARVPRTGGVILARGLSREALDGVLAGDPFHEAGVARHEVVEFVPSKAATDAASLFLASS